MKTKQEILENYEKLETMFDKRFAKRLVDYLTVDELKTIGIEVKGEYVDNWVVNKRWTEENIIKELVSDAKFGKAKAEDERGISLSLMTEVCVAWLFVLEDKDIAPYGFNYNLGFFNRILRKYNV